MAGRMVGFGTVLQCTTYGGTPASTDMIGYIRDTITGPSAARGEVEATALSATAYREYFTTLIDPGTLDFEVMYSTIGSTLQQAAPRLSQWFENETNPLECKIVFPNSAVYMTFEARIMSLGITFPRDDMIVQPVSMRVTGAISWPTTAMV